MPDSPKPLLEARGIHKRFLGVHALSGVDAVFHRGEIVAVMGENGAGKSTLMKCLAGVHQPNEGSIQWEGAPTRMESVRFAADLGIAFIHQELNLADNLSIGANLFLGREPRRGGKLGWIDHAEIRRRTVELLQRLKLRLDPDTLVSDLSIGLRQMVEIAKALSQDAKLLIMDEPTSSLTQHETRTLFEVVRDLKANGMCVVFISHRIAEVEEVADRVIVLRDGKNSGDLKKGEIEHDKIVSLMVGRELKAHQKSATQTGGAVVLEVVELRSQRYPFSPVSFNLKAGEVLGMAGLVGAGRTELARTLFGIDRKAGGEVRIGGAARKITNPRQAIEAGMAFVPEDRKAQGVVLDMSIRDNLAMANLGLAQLQRARFANDRAIDVLAEETRAKLSIRTPNVYQEAGMLSGGNQQKVVIGKWVPRNPKIFLLDEPTRGVDVRSKGQIYELIEQLTAGGAAVLMISSDLEEIMRVSDRVLVMHEGRLAGEVARRDFTEERIMNLATGSN